MPGRLGYLFHDFRAPGTVPPRSSTTGPGRPLRSTPEMSSTGVKALTGASWLHLSGITPALGAHCADTALRAAVKARERGLSRVPSTATTARSYGRAGGGRRAASCVDLADQADLLFADERAIALILGLTLPDLPPADRFQHAANRAFDAFPRLQRLTTTVRVELSVDHHELSAQQVTRTGFTTTRMYSLQPHRGSHRHRRCLRSGRSARVHDRAR